MTTNYYKFIDENTFPKCFDGWYAKDGMIITNPPAETILDLGYKPIEENEYPTLGPDQRAEPYWTEEETVIKQNYRVITDDEINTDEALLIITGGEAK